MNRFQLELGLPIIGHINLYGLRSAVARLLSGGFPGEECSA